MATTKQFLEYVLDQCDGLPVRFRAMMGEYVLYYRDRVAGGLYDGRLMVKDVPGARAMMPDALLEAPYPGAKPLLLVENPDDREFIARLFEAAYPELPAPKIRLQRGRKA